MKAIAGASVTKTATEKAGAKSIDLGGLCLRFGIGLLGQEKLLPQPQERVTLGFSMAKPAPISPSL